MTFAGLQQRGWLGPCRTEHDWWDDDKRTMSASTQIAEPKINFDLNGNDKSLHTGSKMGDWELHHDEQ